MPPYIVIDLYQKRWCIEREGRWGFPSMSNHAVEDAFNTVKRHRKPKKKLIIAPFPDKQQDSNQFFFQSPLKTSLTNGLRA